MKAPKFYDWLYFLLVVPYIIVVITPNMAIRLGTMMIVTFGVGYFYGLVFRDFIYGNYSHIVGEPRFFELRGRQWYNVSLLKRMVPSDIEFKLFLKARRKLFLWSALMAVGYLYAMIF